MKKYMALFRMKFLGGLQYRAAAAAGVLTQFAWGLMSVLLFRAFFRSNPTAFPMEFPQLVSYLWLQQAFLAIYAIWIYDLELFESIAGGQVAYELCRPLEMYGMWFARTIADRTSKAVLRSLPILFVAVLLPAPYGMAAPVSVTVLTLFLLSMALACLLVVAFCMLVYISVFYTLSPTGTRVFTTALTNLLTGLVIPLPFFPEKIRWIAERLPFAYMGNTPLRIYSGNIAGKDALLSIGIQACWVAVFILAGVLWMNRTVRRVVIQGG